MEMLCHPLKIDPASDIGFKWYSEFKGEAGALPVDEFLITSHIVPGHGAKWAGGQVLPSTLIHYSSDLSHYAFSSAYADVWRPEVRRLTLIRLYAVVARARAAGLKLAMDPPLVVVKEVNASHGADIVMSLLPRARMIFLTRDGRDVLDSLLDAHSANGWMTSQGAGTFETEGDRRKFVHETCMEWAARMTICTYAYDLHDPALRRRIRYEDLLADTPGVLADLAEWLDLPGGPKRIENIVRRHSFEAVPEKRKGPGKFRRSASPGAWRQSLSQEDQEVAQEIMGKRLVELGYER
jgi:hypothetical protein